MVIIKLKNTFAKWKIKNITSININLLEKIKLNKIKLLLIKILIAKIIYLR